MGTTYFWYRLPLVIPKCPLCKKIYDNTDVGYAHLAEHLLYFHVEEHKYLYENFSISKGNLEKIRLTGIKRLVLKKLGK